MSNIVTAAFTDRREVIASYVWQYDYGQVLEISGIDLPDTFEVHFSNSMSGESTTSIGSDGSVDIPDAYLTSGSSVYALIFLHEGEDDGETVYKITIPVKRRPEITEDTPTPEEQGVITQAIAALNAAVTATEASETAAATSATEAAASATQAAASATGVAEYATAASNSATAAASSASGASTSATNAANSATAAATSASEAAASATEIETMNVVAETLSAGSSATASWDDGTLTLGIPQGAKGDTGTAGSNGQDGQDGYTPVRGTDYWTTADQEAIVSDVLESSTITQMQSAIADKIDEPATEGTSGQVLATNGNGGRYWTDQTGGVTSFNGQTGAVTVGNATTSTAGFMSASDKSILDTLSDDYSAALTEMGVS